MGYEGKILIYSAAFGGSASTKGKSRIISRNARFFQKYQNEICCSHLRRKVLTVKKVKLQSVEHGLKGWSPGQRSKMTSKERRPLRLQPEGWTYNTSVGERPPPPPVRSLRQFYADSGVSRTLRRELLPAIVSTHSRSSEPYSIKGGGDCDTGGPYTWLHSQLEMVFPVRELFFRCS